MDADGSGYMEEDEGKYYLSACGCIDSELDYYWGDLKRCADTNRDGRISRSEFLNYVVADMDLDEIAEVRNTWQFFRDRRPDTYQGLTAP